MRTDGQKYKLIWLIALALVLLTFALTSCSHHQMPEVQPMMQIVPDGHGGYTRQVKPGSSLIEQRKKHTQTVTTKDKNKAVIFFFVCIGLGIFVADNIIPKQP